MDQQYEVQEDLLNEWIKVMKAICPFVKVAVISVEVIPKLKEFLNSQQAHEKRKLGNQILFSLAKGMGEDGLDNEPSLMNMIHTVCEDNNYKLRRDGAIFLKEYLQEASEKGHLERIIEGS